MSLRSRLAALEERFSQARGGRRLSTLLDALERGDQAVIEEQVRVEREAHGTKGWCASLFQASVADSTDEAQQPATETAPQSAAVAEPRSPAPVIEITKGAQIQ